MTSPPGELGAPLCPSLRRFGLKYDRWLRPTEQFDLIVLASVIQSRARSNYALESFNLWTVSGQKDPLELIEGSQMSIKGFKQLAEASGIEEGLLDFAPMGLIDVTPKPSGESFLPADAFPSQDTHLLDIPQSNYEQPAILQQPHQEEYPADVHPVQESETTSFHVTLLTPKNNGERHYYRSCVTSRISLNREMRYKGVILAPAPTLPNNSQLILRCHAECRSCSSATSTARAQRCRPAAFDLEPVPDPKSDHPFELKFRQDKSNGSLIADMTFIIRYRPRAPKYGDREWCCPSESLM